MARARRRGYLGKVLVRWYGAGYRDLDMNASKRGTPAGGRGRRLLQLVPMLTAAAALWACQGPVSQDGQILRVGVRSQPVSLDPHLQNERLTWTIHSNLYEALTRLDENLRVQPSLAQSWESPDDLTWRFHLRPDVGFHDGTTLEAADVVFSLQRAAYHPNSTAAGSLVALQDVRALDEHTVEILTREPYPLLANKLSLVFIIPDGSPDRIVQPVGTGPFRFISPAAERTFELESWPLHWQGKPVWQELHFVVAEVSEERAELLRARAVDILGDLIPNEMELVREIPGMEVRRITDLSVNFLGVRVDKVPLSDIRVRQALAHAVDRSSLTGNGRVAATQLVNPLVVGFVEHAAVPEHSPETARALLLESGLESGLRLTLDYPFGGEGHAATIHDNLSGIGIQLDQRVVRWDELYRRLQEGQVDLFLASFGCISGDSSDLFDAVLHSHDSQRGYGTANFLGYSSPELDAEVESAANTLDPEERRARLEAATHIALLDLPLIPLFSPQAIYAVRSELVWKPRPDRLILATEVRQ